MKYFFTLLVLSVWGQALPLCSLPWTDKEEALDLSLTLPTPLVPVSFLPSCQIYPWRARWKPFPVVTAAYFRCRGSAFHPPIEGGADRLFDCLGGLEHSLPLLDGQEGVYPQLLLLLNYLQVALNHQVVITSGHQCPTHNRYSDPSHPGSKHQIGAEVDFYVDGLEWEPEQVALEMVNFYNLEGKEKLCKTRNYISFTRGQEENLWEKSDLLTRISDSSWSNQEISVKIVPSDRGRDRDNAHPYPYLTIELKFDCRAEKPVTYSWLQAHRGYYRK